MEVMIQAKGLKKAYGSLQVLKGVDITVQSKEIISIVGASGAGKTTLLQLLGTLDKADSGEIIIAGQDVNQLNEKNLALFRNKHIGFIFQFHHLLPEFTALENVCIPAYIAKQDRRSSEERAMSLLDSLGLAPRSEHKPSALSGGEQQRVAVARAMMMSPDVIFADEPSGNLDSENAQALHELFFKLRDDFGQTFVIVTHNEDLADMADRKLEMKDGRMLG
jgi:lipoprotein-releasing system ATP-binding protein